MRNVINRIISAALAIVLPLAISSCKQEEEAKEASIALKVTGATTESVTFEITTENAATYSYAFAKSSEAGSAEYVTEDAQNGSAVKIEKTGLEAETEYTVKAYATNSDGKDCAEASATAVTTAGATVSIESVSVTPESITFKVVAMNAASVRYAVAGPGEDAETVELSKEAEGVPEQEITEGSLEPGTNYTVVASATNEAGEESERAYLTARTDIEPVIEVAEIVPESDQAKVTVSVGEAVQFAWACTEKGAEIPDRDSFNRVTISGNVNSFIVSDLEESTDYVLSIFGITRSGYEGIIHSEDFTTQEHIEKPFEIKVTDISSTDALISITFDESVYSEYYIIAPSSTYLPDIGTWNWEQKISDMDDPMASRRIKIMEMTGNQEFYLSEFDQSKNIELEGLYNVGGIPRKKDGSLDESAALWRQIRLEPVEFGQSSVDISIIDLKPMMDKVGFKLEIQNEHDFDCLWLKVIEGKMQNSPEEYAKINTMFGKPSYSFDFSKDTLVDYLYPEREYVISAVARDKSGNLSNVAYEAFTTNSVMEQGDAECIASMKEIEANHAVFDIALSEGTSKVLYYYVEKEEDFDEYDFLERLKINNNMHVDSDGELKLEGLSSETAYVFGFCAVAEDGTLGKHYMFEEKTKAHVYDGNAEASVAITIDGVSEDSYGGFMVKISAKPNSLVSKYYIDISDSDNSRTLTKSVFADRCLLGGYYEAYEGSVTLTGWNGQGESCGPEATIWVLAMDSEGRLVPIAETRIEETWK